MAITVPGTIRVSINGRWTNGHAVNNVIDYSGTGFTPQQIAQEVFDGWCTYVCPNLLNNYTAINATFTDLSSTSGDTGTVTGGLGLDGHGGGSNAAMSPNVALLVHKVGVSGRGKRQGRMYLPPPGEITVDENGTIDPAQLADYNTMLRRFLYFSNPFTPGTYNGPVMVVTHMNGPRPPKGVPDNRTGFTTAVDDLSCDAIVATQRRRLRS